MGYLPFIAVFLVSALALFVSTRFSKVDLDSALKIGGGLAAILSLIVGVIEFTSGQREQAASASQAEYIAATEQLTEGGSARPMAGISALAQLAEDNPERTFLMTESLSAFIRFTAPRSDEDQQLPSARSRATPAPYDDPPCQTNVGTNQKTSLEEPYTYSNCNAIRSLLRNNLAVQTALTAIASRNPKNERKSNAPARFMVQIESANRQLLVESQHPRDSMLRSIAEWHSDWQKNNSMESNRQLLQENQEAVFVGYPEILRRPWLNLADSELAGLEADSGFLEGGNLSRSDLSLGFLPGARLAKADLSGSWLVGTDLFSADLRGANLQEADVRGADLGRSNLRQSWMSGGDFHRANLWQADLSNAYLVATDMTEVQTMSGSRMDDVIAYRADFSRATIAGKESGRVCMERAFLEEAKFRCADLRGADLRGANVEDADFTNAQLLGADLRGAKLNRTIVAGANLSRADLRGVDLTHAIGNPSTIEGAVVDEETKLPWSDGKTNMQHDYLGIRRRLSAMHQCRTVRESNDELGKILASTPVRSLVQMRDACPPKSDSHSDFSSQAVSRQHSTVAALARLEIASVPDGADIELDGTPVGSTPTSLGTSLGEHTLKVSKAGYFVWERKFRVSTGTLRLAPELEPVTVGSSGK